MTRAYLCAQVAGELKASDIPLSQAVSQAQYEALKAGDSDPLEVVIEVAPGKSSRGWDYTAEALQKLVSHVEQKSLAGVMGHQREEDLGSEFRPPVTHWIGAAWQDNKALFRGYVDPDAASLKRWIRAGRVTQPSIFTRPVLKGRTVVDLEPLSIDWAPLDRAGMSSARVVAFGEIADSDRPKDKPPEGGGRSMERSELIQAAVALHDAPSFASDAAAHDPGWRELNVGARVAGEMAASTNTPVAELPAYLAALDTRRNSAVAVLDTLRAFYGGKAEGELLAAAQAERARGDQAEERYAKLRLTVLAPLFQRVAGEMAPAALAPLLARDGLQAVGDREMDTDEQVKAYLGELKQTDTWKASLELATTSGTPNPPAARGAQGSAGPDMSVFGLTTAAIGQ